MTLTVRCTKKALMRDNSYPVGVSAPLHVNCDCGKEVPIEGSINRCSCGMAYDQEGWIENPAIISQTKF